MQDEFGFLSITQAMGTHRKFLLKALELTSGPVLELGMGYESTPYLHKYCEAKGRFLYSVDHHFEWVQKFLYLQSSNHLIECICSKEDQEKQKHYSDNCIFVEDKLYISAYDNLRVQEILDLRDRWSVVLIDHIGERRKEEVKRLMHKTDIFVLHDTESDLSVHNWGELWPLFKNRIDDISAYPNSTALSLTIDVAKEFQDCLL